MGVFIPRWCEVDPYGALLGDIPILGGSLKSNWYEWQKGIVGFYSPKILSDSFELR